MYRLGMALGGEERTVHGLFLRSASRHPKRIALRFHHNFHVCDHHSLSQTANFFTYAQVRIMATAAARILQGRGVGPGCVVATCVDEGHLMIITQLAILLAGGAFVPVDPNFPNQRIAYMLQDSQASFVVARGGDISKITLALQNKTDVLETSGIGGGIPTRVPAKCIDVKDLVASADDMDVNAGNDFGDEQATTEDGDDSDDEGNGHDCWIYYTSGSTGLPKGVLCQHRCAVGYLTHHPFFLAHVVGSTTTADSGRDTETHIETDDASAHESKRHCRGVAAQQQQENIEPDEVRVLVPSSFTFDPSAGDIFATLAHGGTVCVAPRGAMLSDLSGCLSSFGATHVCSTPAIWRTVTKDPSELGHLRVVALGGEPMPDAVVARWAHAVTLLNLYGTTEATVYQMMRRMSVGDSPKLLGAPLPGVSIQVVSLDASMEEVGRACGNAVTDAAALPLGAEGELVVMGSQVARGYVARPDLSAARFGQVEGRGARFYRSGDVVKVSSQGLVYVGRTDTQVKVKGVRCELGEIESVLRFRSHLVQEAVVKLDPATKTHLLAWVMLAPDVAAALHTADTHQRDKMRAGVELVLQAICRQRLPPILCPRHFYDVPQFPTIASGKIDREFVTPDGLLPLSGTPFAHSYTAHGEEGAERGGDENEKRPGAGQSMEEKVGQVWREALGLPFHVPLHSNDNFFASGGDSLTALSVIKRLLQWSQSQSRSESAPFQWPEDGMVQGALSVKHLLSAATLGDYAAHLESHAIRLPHPDDACAETCVDAPLNGSCQGEQRGGRERGGGQTDSQVLVDEPHGAGEVRGRGVCGVGRQAGVVTDHTQLDHTQLSVELQGALNALYLVAQVFAGEVGAMLVHLLCDMGVPADGMVSRRRASTAPIHVAAAVGNLEVVRALLQQGATLNLINPTHVTAAQLAAASSPAVLELLLDAGAPVRARDSTKQTLLHHAARAGNVQSIKLLLGRGCLVDINLADKWNRQPLHWAVLNAHLPAVELLLCSGAEAEPRAVPDRVHRRRTSLKIETPAEIAQRVHGGGPLLAALVFAGASAPSTV